MLTLTLPVLAAACLALLVARAALAWLRFHSAMARLPGPPLVPVLGNYLSARRYKGSALDKLSQLCAQYPAVLRLWMTPVVPLVFLQEPDDIRTVLTSPTFVDKPKLIYNSFKSILGPGLAFHARNEWKPIRKAVASSLNKSVLSSFQSAFWANSAQCAAEMERLGREGGVVDVMPLCGRAANYTVIDTMLSTNHSEIAAEDKDTFVSMTLEVNQLIIDRIRRPWLLINWLFSLTKDSKMYNEFSNFSAELVRRVVAHKRAVLTSEAQEGKHPKRGRQSFLYHMLSSDMPLHMDLESDARFLMLAGSATSMETLAFVYYTLSIEQDCQERVHKELQEVFGGDALRPVEDDDLPHLELTERLIMETLRFFPVIPVFSRDVHQDLRLPSGYTLPRGCIASFFLPALHRDPRWFERPDEFDPDRFLPERSRDRHPYAFIPFSAGPRNCVALRYAMAFLKTHVATVLRRVQLLPAPGAPSRVQDVRVKMKLTLGVRGGANVIVKPRVIESPG